MLPLDLKLSSFQIWIIRDSLKRRRIAKFIGLEIYIHAIEEENANEDFNVVDSIVDVTNGLILAELCVNEILHIVNQWKPQILERIQ